MRRRFFLIYNTRAGTARTATVDAVASALIAAGASVERATSACESDARSEAAQAARSGRYEAIVTAGGDGTVRQAAAAASGSDCPVGAIMLGTGNVLAHELGLPRSPAAIADMLMNGKTLDVPLGRANGEPFLLMAGVGFDGRVVAELDHRLKQRIAKAAYVPPVLKALAAPLDRLVVTCDGETSDATWVVVTNSRCYGGQFVLTDRTSLEKPGLIAVLFRARSKPQLIGQLVSLAMGRLMRRIHGDVDMRPVRDVRIVSKANPVPVQIDGDVFSSTPLHVEDSGARVRLIVPR
jgi:diacylglycerol kinase family enzyme